MQISKDTFDKMMFEMEVLSKELTKTQQEVRDLGNRCITFDRILDKVLAAANGFPLTSSRNGYEQVNLGGYSDHQPHRCTPFTDQELRQGELEALREQSMMLAERLAAVRAIAEFAKEHKA